MTATIDPVFNTHIKQKCCCLGNPGVSILSSHRRLSISDALPNATAWTLVRAIIATAQQVAPCATCPLVEIHGTFTSGKLLGFQIQ